MRVLAALAGLGLLANAHPHDEDNHLNRPKSKDSKIAVVGGGIAGIYSAYKLSKLGYKEITVFEKSSRIGGKAQTVRMSGHHTDLGTLHWLPAAYDWIFATAEELNLPVYNYYFQQDFFTVYWYPITLPEEFQEEYGEQMTLIDFMEHPVIKGKEILKEVMEVYTAKFKEYFTYSNDQYWWPDMTTDEQMEVLGTMTFHDWLVANDLMMLYPFAAFATSFFLYGQPHTLTAFHGLYLSHPDVFNMIIEKKYATYVPYAGYQGFVETMALDQQLHVIYNAQISRIIRKNDDSGRCKKDDCVVITYKTKAMAEPIVEKFDFLINAIHPAYYNKKALKMTKQEAEFFDLDKWESNRLGLTISMPNKHNKADYRNNMVGNFLGPMLEGTSYEHVLCLNRKIMVPQGQMVRNDTGSGADCATYTAWNYDQRMPEFINCYTENFNVPMSAKGISNGVADNEAWNAQVAKDVVKITEGTINVQQRDIRYQHKREYLNRYNFASTAAGYPIKLFNYNLENNRNTWFVGAYASFEMMARISDQIELLLERSGVKERVEERPNFRDKFFDGPHYMIAPGMDGEHAL